MSLLLRYALPFIVVGLVVGLVLRRVWGRSRLRLAIVLSLLPVPIHAVATWSSASRRADPGSMLLVFLIVMLLILGVVLWYGLRLVRVRPLWAAAMPVVATGLYLAIPYALLVLRMRQLSARLDVLPTLVLLGTITFLAAVLLSFAPRAPKLSLPNPGRWLRRR